MLSLDSRTSTIDHGSSTHELTSTPRCGNVQPTYLGPELDDRLPPQVSHNAQWAKHTYRQQAPADAASAKAQVLTDIAAAATACAANEPGPLVTANPAAVRTSFERVSCDECA